MMVDDQFLLRAIQYIGCPRGESDGFLLLSSPPRTMKWEILLTNQHERTRGALKCLNAAFHCFRWCGMVVGSFQRMSRSRNHVSLPLVLNIPAPGIALDQSLGHIKWVIGNIKGDRIGISSFPCLAMHPQVLAPLTWSTHFCSFENGNFQRKHGVGNSI